MSCRVSSPPEVDPTSLADCLLFKGLCAFQLLYLPSRRCTTLYIPAALLCFTLQHQHGLDASAATVTVKYLIAPRQVCGRWLAKLQVTVVSSKDCSSKERLRNRVETCLIHEHFFAGDPCAASLCCLYTLHIGIAVCASDCIFQLFAACSSNVM